MPVYRVTLFSTMFGQELRNVMQFFKEGGTQADMVSLAGEIENRWISQTKFLSCGDLVYYKIHVMVPSQQGWEPIDRALTQPGAAGGNQTRSLFTAMVLQIRTSNHTRKGTGRHYIAGIRQDGLVGGKWDFGTMNQAQSVGNSLLGQFGGAVGGTGYTLVVAPRTNPDANIHEVTSIVPRDYPGTQVRRNFKRGS